MRGICLPRLHDGVGTGGDSEDSSRVGRSEKKCSPYGDKVEDSVWRKVPLVKDNWLSPRAQIPACKQMLVVECPNGDEPPATAADLCE